MVAFEKQEGTCHHTNVTRCTIPSYLQYFTLRFMDLRVSAFVRTFPWKLRCGRNSIWNSRSKLKLDKLFSIQWTFSGKDKRWNLYILNLFFLLLTFVILPKLELVSYCKVHFRNIYVHRRQLKNIFWSAFDLSEKVELCTGPLDKHNKYDCLMGHSHSESNCNLHNTWLHISPSLKGTSLQKKYLLITPPDDLLFSSIHI